MSTYTIDLVEGNPAGPLSSRIDPCERRCMMVLAYSLRGTPPVHVAREGPYAAVLFCCQGMRPEGGHRGGGSE